MPLVFLKCLLMENLVELESPIQEMVYEYAASS